MPGTSQGAKRKLLTTKPSVHNFVSNVCATQLMEILTESSPELNRLFTKLFTAQNAENQRLKSEAARERCNHTIEQIIACAQYGWHFGISGHTEKSSHQVLKTPCRRTKVLGKAAIQAGLAIGKAQRAEAEKRHHLQT